MRLAVLLEDRQDSLGEFQRVLLEVVVLEIDPRPADHGVGIENGLSETLRVRIAIQQLADLGDGIDGAGIRRAHGADDGGNRNFLGREILQDFFQMDHIHLVGS